MSTVENIETNVRWNNKKVGKIT